MNKKNKIICQSCSAENPQDKKFCMKCGSKLTAAEPEQKSVPEKKTVICPSCSAENQQGKKFCMKCGSKLAAAEPEKKSVPVKNTVIQNTDKSSSRPVFTDNPHTNVPSEAAAVTVKNKSNLKIYCAVIIAVLLILVVIALIPNSETQNPEIQNSKMSNSDSSVAVTITEHDENELTAITNKYANDNDTENSSINMSDTDTAAYSEQGQTEKQIRILEDYYENTLKPMQEYDGHRISSMGSGEIYALNDDGDCVLLVYLVVDSDDILLDIVAISCTVDSNGNVNTETLFYNTGGSVSYSSVEIKKCSVNNKFYYVNYFHGLEQYNSYSYASFDGSEDLEIYMLGVDRLFYVDGYPVTQSSYEEYTSYLDSIMINPVPTRKDGDVSVYLQDFSAVNNNKIPAGAELVPPENFNAETIDVSNIKFSWDKVEGENITYTVYMVKNGKYIKVLDTTFTYSYSIDGEKTDYCVTASSDSIYVSESGYSNISRAEDSDFRSYSAIDFIGVEFKNLYEYAQKNGGYYSSEQGINCFWIDGIPYQFYGELVDYNSGYVTDNYVRGIEIYEGDRVDGDIIFDKNIVKNLAKKYQQSKAVLEVAGDEGGGLSGINVKIDIGNNLSAVIKYGIPDDPENVYDPMFSFEETEAYYDNIIKKYDNKAIDINDVEAVFGTYAISCRIITEGVYLY